MKLSKRLQRLKRRLAAANQRGEKGFAKALLSIGTKVKMWSNGPHVRLYAATFAAGLLLMGGSYLVVDRIQSTQAWDEVFSNGTYMGMVPDDTAVVAGLQQTADAYNIKVDFAPVHLHVGADYNWASVANLPTTAVAIRSNGKPLVYVASKFEAQTVLNDVETALTPKDLKGNAKVAFASKVDVVPTIVSVTSIYDTTSAVHYLLAPATYRPVGRSESLASVVASARTISAGGSTEMESTASLLSGANEAQILPLNLDTSQYTTTSTSSGGSTRSAGNTTFARTTGDAETTRGSTASGAANATGVNGSSGPLLSVQATETVTKVAPLQYPVHYVKTAHLGLGSVKVLQQGQPGKVQEKVLVSYVNGKVAAEKILDKQVVEQPRPEVADQGTNSGVASGTWGWPTDLFDITSGYGWRAFGGGTFHPGIDIGVPIGSPVYATNNGVVIEAGWNSGGYGNWVMINNGNGIETIFGHLSQVLVHAGQTVAKGDLIAKSGSTGYSTGPHLHYEVRLNGQHINPTPYM